MNYSKVTRLVKTSMILPALTVNRTLTHNPFSIIILTPGQMDHLNAAFSGATCCNATLDWCDPGTCSIDTGLRFAWALLDDEGNVIEGSTVPDIGDAGACALRINNHDWTKVGQEDDAAREMKNSLRKGGANVLNAYWTSFVNPELAAYATYPFASFPLTNGDPGRGVDGVVIRTDLITDGEATNYNEGDILVHEVGHWLGLLHTFDGGCGKSDGIADTPKERAPFRGCGNVDGFDLDRNTCGDGEMDPIDPIFNYMDYSDDRCRFHFTPGQVLLMQACYDTFRLKQKKKRDVISLTNNVPSDPLFLAPRQRQIFSMETRSPVRCTASAEEGRYSLYLRWGHRPCFFPLLDRCARCSRGGAASCTARFRLGRTKLYAGIKASLKRGGQNLTITCTEI
jgi:hypothetical protein